MKLLTGVMAFVKPFFFLQKYKLFTKCNNFSNLTQNIFIVTLIYLKSIEIPHENITRFLLPMRTSFLRKFSSLVFPSLRIGSWFMNFLSFLLPNKLLNPKKSHRGFFMYIYATKDGNCEYRRIVERRFTNVYTTDLYFPIINSLLYTAVGNTTSTVEFHI